MENSCSKNKKMRKYALKCDFNGGNVRWETVSEFFSEIATAAVNLLLPHLSDPDFCPCRLCM